MSDQLRRAVQAIKAGDKYQARHLLQEILAHDPKNEEALMWMSHVAGTVNMRIQYLEEVLEVNPSNRTAKKDLVRLTQKMEVSPEVQAKLDNRADAAKNNRLRLTVLLSIAVILGAGLVYLLLDLGLLPWPL